MKKKILVTRQYPPAGIRLLEKENHVLTIWDKSRSMTQDELVRASLDHDAILCTLTDRIDARFLDQCRHLEMISQFAVGFDNIDVKHATQLGIPVGHTPGVLTRATADLAFGLMIAVARKMIFNHKTILRGEWGSFNPTGHLGVELKGKRLGVFGLGRIGIETALLCKKAYDMDVIYCNRTGNPDAEALLDAKPVDFNTLLAKSDIVSVHCVLSPQTEGVFDLKAFKKMKPSAIFINTARGGIHREKDLIQALEQGFIWGAGLDVTDPEPMAADNPLLDMETVCVLPHVGSATVEARSAMSVLAATNLIEFYKHGTIPHIVNPEVIKK